MDDSRYFHRRDRNDISEDQAIREEINLSGRSFEQFIERGNTRWIQRSPANPKVFQAVCYKEHGITNGKSYSGTMSRQCLTSSRRNPAPVKLSTLKRT